MANSTGATATRSDFGRPLIHVARELGVHLATLHRWRITGVLDPFGNRRKLAMVRVGGRWQVRDTDLSIFFDSLSATSVGETASPADRSRAAGQADRELDQIGI